MSTLTPKTDAAIDELLAIMDVEREEWKQQLAAARAEVATLNYTIDYLRKNSLHAATILDNGITPAEEESR